MTEKETTGNQTTETPSSESNRKKIGLKAVNGVWLPKEPEFIMVVHPDGGGIEVVPKEDKADDEEDENEGEGILGVTEEETIMYVDPNGNVTESK